MINKIENKKTMTEDTLTTEIQSIMRKLFGEPDLVIQNSMTANDVSRWDSLSHIEFIMCVEKAFKVRFKNSEVGRLENIGDLVSAVLKKAR